MRFGKKSINENMRINVTTCLFALNVAYFQNWVCCSTVSFDIVQAMYQSIIDFNKPVTTLWSFNPLKLKRKELNYEVLGASSQLCMEELIVLRENNQNIEGSSFELKKSFWRKRQHYLFLISYEILSNEIFSASFHYSCIPIKDAPSTKFLDVVRKIFPREWWIYRVAHLG